jgi:hypothetical protein
VLETIVFLRLLKVAEASFNIGKYWRPKMDGAAAAASVTTDFLTREY